MDEENQETIQTDSEAVSNDFDSGKSLKRSADEEIKPLPRKNSSELSNIETVTEANALSTNGIDNESVETPLVFGSENVTEKPDGSSDLDKSDEVVLQSEEKTSTNSFDNKSNNESSAVSESLDCSSKEFSSSNENTCNEINDENDFSVVGSQNIIGCNINSSNGSDSGVTKEKIQGQVPPLQEITEEFVDLKSQSSESMQFKEQTNVQDLNENNESSEIIRREENNPKEVCLSEENLSQNFDGKENSSSSNLKVIESKKEMSPVQNQESDNTLEKGELEKEKEAEDGKCSEKINESGNEIQEEKDLENKDFEEHLSRVSPMNVDSEICSEVKDFQDAKKFDIVNQSEDDKKQSTSSDSEIEKDNLDFQNKNDSVHESNSSQSIINTSGTSGEQDEEIANRSENDGNEVLATEMVNCNEIEQIDFNENESQKDKEIDRIGIEPNETDSKGENKEEEMDHDLLATVGENCGEDKILQTNSRDEGESQRDVILVDSETNNQPGNSEEETITGDTSNQTTADLAKGKEEEVCIIPDDMVPRLSILPQNKEIKSSEGETGKKTEFKILRVSTPELEKPKTRLQDKKSEGSENSKPRPVRNAAKLAGNKIKSLVENDLVVEDQSGGDGERENEIRENVNESAQICAQCREVKMCKFIIIHGDGSQYLCSEQCSGAFKTAQMEGETGEVDNALGHLVRKCAQCHSQVTVDERCLFWETMDFCNEDCLGKYQTELGSSCAYCKGSVASSSLGKYCVRFGYDVKQFCSAGCLEEYKKGLKVCSYCQKDISTGAEGFLAPVGDKGQFKDFCTQSCMEKYERMSSNAPSPDVIEECAVCSNSKPVRVEVQLDTKTHKLCSEPCFAAFKFVNNITEGQCDMCRKYFDRAKTPSLTLFYDDSPRSFCCKTCMNVYILANRKIVPCNWCKVKKYNFDMIKKVSANGQLTMMCSLNCFTLYQVSVNAVCSRRIKCDFCLTVSQAQYHLTMSDATIRNFCSYNCVMSFQNRYPKQNVDLPSGTDQLTSPIPTGGPKRATSRRSQVESPCGPVISSIQSLASPNGPASPSGRVTLPRGDLVSQSITMPTTGASMPAPPPQVYQQIITKPAPAKQMKNKSVLCKPYSHTKGVSCRPHPCMKETQTDQSLNRKFLIPIPVPIYVPAPMHMFATPFPVPVPFPLPIPVPVFIPTTRNSAKGIFKEIKKIQEKIPTDPFEAELLMMAEMVAGDKKQDPTDSESEEGDDGGDGGDGTFSPENVDTSNTFGEDMLQMALKMASELEEPAVDMESVLTSNTITTSTQPAVDPNKALYASDPDDPDQVHMAMNRGRKRSARGSRNSAGGTPSKRGRRTSGSVDVPLLPPPEPVPPPRIEVEKPDANMCLKYTFGVNAWRHWVMQKNAELEKAALTNRKIKLFKPELLQLTSDELNFSLCLFVKEVRKPNGTEYAPDTIYYLCLGIQQYLFENGRIDNIFTDSYYEKFTDCLDEVAKKFAALYNDSQYIVTRVEEEHLWESKQLGAHSPHVLLSTLMFFNTKHFNLVTVEEHMQLSFSHIMKHWKRNPNTPGVAKVPGSRNVLLRFYPPQSALEANSRKKKVYEQQENEENPLRCPVKLYEFYLSKCPESVKTRNDVFYLLPERSCVPDSPVWYSTMALGKEPLMKMLHRVKMVKEINIALLTC